MAVVEKSEAATTEAAGHVEEPLYRVYPDMERRVDYELKTVSIEIHTPGVKKNAIKLKALPTWFHFEARKGNMIYSANMSWGVEIVPEKTSAKYENGLLVITAYIRDPLDGAKEVQL